MADNLSTPGKRHAPAQSHKLQPAVSVSLTLAAVGLAIALRWARHWLLAGAGIESLLLIYGASTGSRIFPEIPLWTLLSSLNVVYAVSSTSWLLHGVFAGMCYPIILLTSVFQFELVSGQARKLFRALLINLHFTKDTIAFFDIPALEIDTDVSGLFVVRGLSISLSSMRILVHGVELGLRLADDIELALHVDQVDIRLFRRIDIGDVYSNVKGGKTAMTFADVESSDVDDDDSIFQVETSWLQAAAASASRRPGLIQMKSQMTGGSYMKDSSVRETLDTMTTISPDDEKADQTYQKMLRHILTTGPVFDARRQAESSSGDAFAPQTENDLRAAICVKLQDIPTVPNPPSRSIRVTTLQTLSPPYVRRFLHRLPFLLRLLLMPISYFHPIRIASICAAGSGHWVTSLLQEKLFKGYALEDGQVRRLERKVVTWLASANLCLQLTGIEAEAQVPLNPSFDIHNYLQFSDIIAYRIVPDTGTIRSVVQLGGADASVSIPSFLLPHHEHLLPPRPDDEALEKQIDVANEADGKVKTVQAEQELEKMKADEVEMNISIHAKLPACFDQSLLNFVAALVKASKIIEMDKTVSEESEAEAEPEPDDASIHSATTSPVDSISPTDTKSSRAATTFKTFATGIRQNIKDVRAGESLRELARSTKDGLKKAAVGGLVNDRWIAKMVGKVAANLEQAQGDVGYSGAIGIPLEPYRQAAEPLSKLLP